MRKTIRMDSLSRSYFSVEESIKKARKHLKELTDKKKNLEKNLYGEMTKRNLTEYPQGDLVIKLEKIRPLEIRREERDLKKMAKLAHIKSILEGENLDSDKILDIVLGEMKKRGV